jgi:UDP-galactopyranose mutase
MTTDFLIVGAGFAGLVAAERLTNAGFRCVVVDKRSHLGGNAYDSPDATGVLIHRYGPHYFRTNSPRIVEYLSRFTEWHRVDYTIKSFTGGRYWSFPINLNTFEEWLGRPSTTEEMEAWLAETRASYPEPKNSEEAVLGQVGEEFYRRFFEGYTLKQWKRHPRELDASVCGRIPVRTNRDDRYLSEDFQALPKDGYTAMFEKMVAASPGLELHLDMDFQTARERWACRHLIFTGPIDEYFGYCFGPLPYRSLRFETESFTPVELIGRESFSNKPGHWQPAMQVNYPEADVPFTRIVEIKHATGQEIAATTIVREFPHDWQPGEEPFYPIPADDTKALYLRYAALGEQEENVTFIGRLGTYRYYNMDQVTGMALKEAEKLALKYGSVAEINI